MGWGLGVEGLGLMVKGLPYRSYAFMEVSWEVVWGYYYDETYAPVDVFNEALNL